MKSSRMIRVCKMGVVNYLDALKLQERLVSVRKTGDVLDTLLSLQHPPTYTLGKRRTDHNLLVSPSNLWKMGAELHYTERGGDITFHGPHQAVLYPIISLREIGLGPRRYVEKLESTMIELASLYGVKACPGGSLETGVWVKDRKIGAIGIHISGRVTSHGLAFNVDPDLNYFKHIVPCGIADKEVTSLRREVTSATTLDEDAVEDELISCFIKQFGYSDIVHERRDSLLPRKPETKMNDQPHMLNPPPPMMMAAAAQPLQPVMMGQNPQLMAQPLQILTYSHWPQQQQHNNSQLPGGNHNLKFHAPMDHAFGGSSKNPKQMHSLPVRNNWKGKKTAVNLNDPRKDMRKGPNSMMTSGGMMGAAGYQPPNIGDLQYQNRLNSRKFYPKRKYSGRFTPYAPRNTSSFIMRAKKSGGIASLVSPCPVTPAVLPTPIFSPSREVLGDMAKEEWGVDGYGSMKGLIRLRNNEVDMNRENEEEEDDNEDEANGSSESDVEEEKDSVLSRLDHETSRFEMVYPNYGFDHNILLENRVDDQDTHIAQLEEENLILRERLFLMEREMEDLRRRLNFLERQNRVDEDANEEVVENGTENESDEGSDFHPTDAGNRIADGHGDSEEKNDELTEGTSKAMLGEEKPVDEEKRYDGVTVGISAEGNDGKNGEMQPDASSQEADAEMGEHENLEQ